MNAIDKLHLIALKLTCWWQCIHYLTLSLFHGVTILFPVHRLYSLLFLLCDTILNKSILGKSELVLSLSLRGYSLCGRGVMVAGTWGIGSHCVTVRSQRQMKTGAQFTFSSHFLFRPDPQPMGWCWYWVYFPQLNLSGNSTLEINREVYILGDS